MFRKLAALLACLFSPASLLANEAPPWRLDTREAREAALKEAKPCVLILHVDSSAL